MQRNTALEIVPLANQLQMPLNRYCLQKTSSKKTRTNTFLTFLLMPIPFHYQIRKIYKVGLSDVMAKVE